MISDSTFVSSSPCCGRHECERLACGAHARGATDAMHVYLGVVGNVVVDDVADVRDVDAAAGQVGRHQHVELSAAEALHHAVALVLREVAMDLPAFDPVGMQPLGDLLRAALGSAEHDRQIRILLFEQRRSSRYLSHRRTEK